MVMRDWKIWKSSVGQEIIGSALPLSIYVEINDDLFKQQITRIMVES